MKEKLNILIATSRPVSWVNTAYPFAAGYLVSGGQTDTRFWVGTLFFLIPYNLVMYGVNDVYDYESDIRNPRKGGVEGAVTAKRFHSLILWACAISAVPFLTYLLLTGSLLANIVLAIVMFFVLAYSMRGLRFKEIPLLDSITSSAHFVGPLVYALALFDFPGSTWPYVAAFFLWGIASQALGAVQDIIPDREAKIHSIATVFGARNTMLLSTLAYFAAALIVMLQGGLAIVVGIAGLLYVLNNAPNLVITDKSSAKARSSWKRFLWVNYIVGAVITMTLVATAI